MKRRTRQRDAILTAFTSAARPLAPVEALEAAQRAVPTLGIATVYRSIRELLDDNLITVVELPGQPARYEARSAAHRHHFHCDACGRVYPIEGCVPGIDGLAPRRFAVRSHAIVLFGECDECVTPRPGARRQAKRGRSSGAAPRA
jgi:Fur family ferric uptake transcriptional regulator